MHNKKSRSRSELWLGRQLRNAACREQPEFSEALHRRIMHAVRPASGSGEIADAGCSEGGATVAEKSVAVGRRKQWRAAAWLTVAAAIVAMAAGRWFASWDGHTAAQPMPSLSQLPSQVVRTAENRPAPVPNQTIVASTAKPADAASADAGPVSIEPDDIMSAAASYTNYTLDDLGRDAQATAHLVVDQLPFETQAEDWGL